MKEPVTLTPEEADAVRRIIQIVTDNEVEFVLGDDTSALDSAVAKLEASA
jgi:hypothetical protein